MIFMQTLLISQLKVSDVKDKAALGNGHFRLAVVVNGWHLCKNFQHRIITKREV